MTEQGEIVDAEYVFRMWLESIPGVQSIAGRRVAKSPLPAKKRIPRSWECTLTPAVTYFRSGGSKGNIENLPVESVVMTVECWAVSEDVAGRLYRSIAKIVAQPGGDVQIGAGVKMHGFGPVENTDGVAGRNKESKLWAVMVDYEFKILMFGT